LLWAERRTVLKEKKGSRLTKFYHHYSQSQFLGYVCGVTIGSSHNSSILVIVGIILLTSTRLILVMDVTTFAAKPESYNRLSLVQISTFFSSNTSATREQCDKLAAKLLGGPVSAIAIQGGSSYTVQRPQARKVV
jgi:hypothetical protein